MSVIMEFDISVMNQISSWAKLFYEGNRLKAEVALLAYFFKNSSDPTAEIELIHKSYGQHSQDPSLTTYESTFVFLVH